MSDKNIGLYSAFRIPKIFVPTTRTTYHTRSRVIHLKQFFRGKNRYSAVERSVCIHHLSEALTFLFRSCAWGHSFKFQNFRANLSE